MFEVCSGVYITPGIFSFSLGGELPLLGGAHNLWNTTNRWSWGRISVDRKTSLLSYLQYPVQSKSSTKDLSPSVPVSRVFVVFGRGLSLHVNTESGVYHRFSAWILT